MSFDNIPEEFKQLPRWVCWKLEERKGKFTKIPYNSKPRQDGSYGMAMSNNPETWGSFEQAIRSIEDDKTMAGIGFMLGDGFVGVDIDDVQEDGILAEHARDIIATLDSFTEFSPSGQGLHVICRGKLPEGRRQVYIEREGKPNAHLGIYDERRFFCMTGNVLDDAHTDIEERTEQLAIVHEKYINVKKTRKSESKTPAFVSESSKSDDELIEIALNAKNGNLFAQLMDGNWKGRYSSQSEADIALCNLLAFYTQCDAAQMQRIFQRSGLFREKWSERRGEGTYGEITINRAIADCTETYTPPALKSKPKHKQQNTEPPEIDLGLDRLADAPGPSDEKTADPLNKIIEGPEDVFDLEYIGALALARRKDPVRYAAIKSKLKGIVSLNDLERTIKQTERPNLKVAAPDDLLHISDVFRDAPCSYLRVPPGWEMTMESGITKTVLSEFGTQKLTACPHPIYITKRIRSIESGTEKLEISFYRDYKWISVILDRANVFSRQSIISLTDYGVQVSSETAKNLVSFFDDFEAENANLIPLERSIGRFGWVDSNVFFPYASGIVHDKTGEIDKLISAIREKGSYQTWRTEIDADRQRSYSFRFIVAASFASPLLYSLGQRVGMIHLWTGSMQGKTATGKAALSVWGCPDELIASFNTTLAGIERAVGAFHHLPLVVDERQALNTKRIDISELIYVLSLGKGRTRSNRQGGLQEYSTWQNIILTTGEEPLTRENSQNGEITRVLEIYARPFQNPGRASDMHNITAQNHGYAGKAFIERLISEIRNDAEYLQKVFSYMKNNLQFGNNLRSHSDLIAIVCAADCLASMWVWGYPKSEAITQALKMGSDIISKLETRTDTVTRAWDYTKAWLASNSAKFQPELFECWGISDNESIYIIPQYLNNALSEAGFSKEQCIREFGNRGYITKSSNSSGYACVHSQKKINGKNVKVYKIPQKLLSEESENDEYEQMEFGK